MIQLPDKQLCLFNLRKDKKKIEVSKTISYLREKKNPDSAQRLSCQREVTSLYS